MRKSWVVLGLGLAAVTASSDEIDDLAEKLRADIQKSRVSETPKLSPESMKRVRQVERITAPDRPLAVTTAGLYPSPYFERYFSGQGYQPKSTTFKDVPLNLSSHVLGNFYQPFFDLPTFEKSRNHFFASYLGNRDFKAGVAASVEGETAATIDANLSSRRGPFQSSQDLAWENFAGEVDKKWGAATRSRTALVVRRSHGIDPGWVAARQNVDRFAVTNPTGKSGSENYLLQTDLIHEFSSQRLSFNAFGGRHSSQSFSNPTGEELEFKDGHWIYGGKIKYQLIEEGRESRLVTTMSFSADSQDADTEQNKTYGRQLVSAIRNDRSTLNRLQLAAKQEIQWLSWVKTDASVSLVNTSLAGNGYQASALLIAPEISLQLDFDKAFDIRLATAMEARPRDIRGVTGTDAKPITEVVQYEAAVGSDLIRNRLRAEMAVYGALWEEEPWYDAFQNRIENLPTRNHLGIEWKAKAKLGLTSELLGSFALQESTFAEIPNQMVRVSAKSNLTDNLSVQWGVHYFGERKLIRDSSYSSPGFWLSDISASLQKPGYRITAGIENLFNSKWNEMESAIDSKLPGETVAVRDVIFRPGKPLTVVAKAEVYF